MHPFALPEWTPVRIETVIPRAEKHGEEEVIGLSLHLKLSGSNDLLDLVSGTLRTGLYEPLESETLPGVSEVRKKLRSPDIGGIVLALKKLPAIEAAVLYLDYGVDGDAHPIVLTKTKVDAFRAAVYEGGSAEVIFRCGSNDIDADELGKICSKLHQTINVRVELPPKPVELPEDGEVIDGTTGHPGAQPLFDGEADDPLYAQAVEVARSEKRVSISLIQRHLRIGYNRAARLVEQLEKEGIASRDQSFDGDVDTDATERLVAQHAGDFGTFDEEDKS